MHNLTFLQRSREEEERGITPGYRSLDKATVYGVLNTRLSVTQKDYQMLHFTNFLSFIFCW